MLGGRFGASGARVVVEEFMRGEEASLFALSDGVTALLFGAAQDHKRAFDGDLGPNTGGMGTYSPPPVLTQILAEQARKTLMIRPSPALAAEGRPYRGVLYAGLMLTDEGPKLVEFNARFGDPECQVLMLRLKSDLVLSMASAIGGLAELPQPEWSDEAAVCVVLAAEGYPAAPMAGTTITGAEAVFGENVVVFHAGTTRAEDGVLKASGGRVLNVCARGATLAEARARAYAAVDAIDWPGGFHRRDIGWRAWARLHSAAKLREDFLDQAYSRRACRDRSRLRPDGRRRQGPDGRRSDHGAGRHASAGDPCGPEGPDRQLAGTAGSRGLPA